MPFLALPRHRDAAGGLIFCVCYFPFFKYSPFYSTTGERMATRIVALTLSMKKFIRLQIWWNLVQ